jgi:hypothetical protein
MDPTPAEELILDVLFNKECGGDVDKLSAKEFSAPKSKGVSFPLKVELLLSFLKSIVDESLVMDEGEKYPLLYNVEVG